MTTDPQLIAALIGFFGAVIAGAIGSQITVRAMLRIQRKTDIGLEVDEVRKRRVGIIHDLLGSRYVLQTGYTASSNEVQAFNTAMALFSVYFAKDRDVTQAYDRFLNDKSNQNLFDMLKVAARHAGLDLLDTQLSKVMTVQPTTFVVTIQPTGMPAPGIEKKIHD